MGTMIAKGHVAMNYYIPQSPLKHDGQHAEQFRAALYGNHDTSHKQLDAAGLIRH
jgi:hypothetical protein